MVIPLIVVKTLLQAGVDPNIADNPLIVAIENGHFDIVFALLEFGANPDILDGNGKTPLMAASKSGHFKAVH